MFYSLLMSAFGKRENLHFLKEGWGVEGHAFSLAVRALAGKPGFHIREAGFKCQSPS